MTFLHFSMLAGLALVALPVVIHLLNRHKAKPVPWAAMRFLMASLQAQRRRLLLEEVVLLALRCLLVAAVALAMARPFLPSQAAIPWGVILPLFMGAAICAGIAAAVGKNLRLRRQLLRASALLALVAIAAAALEQWLLRRQWLTPAGERAIVIIVDGSDSMRLLVDGRSNFQHAVDEASAVVDTLKPGDTAGIILAGPQPRAVGATMSSDRAALKEILAHRDFQPPGGSMGVLEAFNAAATMLANARNPVKKILLITDGQAVNWDPQSQPRWAYLAQNLRELDPQPKILCRLLPMPLTVRNAAIAGVALSRQIIGTDRPVHFAVTVQNPGAVPVQPNAVVFAIDGQPEKREPFQKELAPGAAETLRFEYQFPTPGRHLATFQLVYKDDLEADNTAIRAVDVLDRLPALIVDGAPSTRPLDSAAALIKVALAPVAGNPDPSLRLLIAPELLAAADAAVIGDLAKYRVIILSNVPRLPGPFADRLTEFVRGGGGLLLIPGNQTDAEFYNRLRTRAGEPFLPAVFAGRRGAAAKPAHLDLKSFTHPALKLIGDAGQSDAAGVLVQAWWRLQPDAQDSAVRVCGRLDTGEPFWVERQLGRGFILAAAFNLDTLDSTLPASKSYVPLLHELVHYLAAPAAAEPNLRPGEEIAFELAAGGGPRRIDSRTAVRAQAAGSTKEIVVETPAGGKATGTITTVNDQAIVRFSETLAPGLYRLQLPPEFKPAAGGGSLPFVVASPPGESGLKTLTDADFAAFRNQVEIFPARARAEMLAAIGGGIPGEEIWKPLILVALLAALAEVALTRWIALQRRLHAAETVTLTTPAEDLQAFGRKAREMMKQ